MAVAVFDEKLKGKLKSEEDEKKFVLKRQQAKT